jgi:hypothetical protein
MNPLRDQRMPAGAQLILLTRYGRQAFKECSGKKKDGQYTNTRSFWPTEEAAVTEGGWGDNGGGGGGERRDGPQAGLAAHCSASSASGGGGSVGSGGASGAPPTSQKQNKNKNSQIKRILVVNFVDQWALLSMLDTELLEGSLVTVITQH